MKEIVVISGKGGTGKTSFTASLVPRLKNLVLADCDVDAPDLNILLNPEPDSIEDFVGTRKARIDPVLCNACGLCVDSCRFDALRPAADPGSAAAPTVLDSRCEGCGVCAHVCPQDAIRMDDTVVGTLTRATTAHGPMVHARLVPGEETSGKLVFAVRQAARALAEEKGADFVLVDGSPGIGCNVISSLSNADAVVIVTEPSVAAFHDLKRVVDLVRRFSIPMIVVINKHDLSASNTRRIKAYCREAGLPVGMTIPFDESMIRAITDRRIPSEALPDFFRRHGFNEFVEQLVGGD